MARKQEKDSGSRDEGSAATAPTAAPARSGFDVLRENVEALIVAIILALIIRHFAVEAFEIPTGSMAPTLYGIHAWLQCPNCDTEFNVALGSDQATGKVNVHYTEKLLYHRPCANPDCSLSVHEVGRGGQVTCEACGTVTTPRRKDCQPGRARNLDARCPICHFLYRALLEENNQTGGHKILVTKFAYVVSDPRRWDVGVFGFDQWKNYIKRLVGLPGERIDAWDGDLYVNGKVERKPLHAYIQSVLWTKISDSDVRERGLSGRPGGPPHPPAWMEPAPKKIAAWNPTTLRWSVNARGDAGVLDYQRPFDNYYNYDLSSPGAGTGVAGYPNGVQVGDRKVAFTVRPARGGGSSPPAAGGVPTAWVGAEIRDREFTFQLRLPLEGTGSGEAVIERMTNDDGTPPSPLRPPHPESLRAACPFTLAAGAPARIEFENVDDRVALRVGGREMLALEYVSLPAGVDVTAPDTVSPSGGARQYSLRLIVVNAQVELESIQVFRDMYYIDERPDFRGRPWSGIQLGPGEYLAMGDNAPSSSDGRAWGFVPEKNLMGKGFVVFWPAWPWNFQWQRIR